MKWLSVSEIVMGLVLEGRMSPSVVQPEMLMPPYDALLNEYRKSRDTSELIAKFGVDAVNTALHAAHSINGAGQQAEWLALLERSRNNTMAGNVMERMTRKLQMGEDIDWEQIKSLAVHCTSGIGNGFTSMDKITAMEVPFKETGFAPIDVHLGGLPEIGQVLVGAPPGSGKTSLLIQLAGCWVRRHPTEKVIIFTLEMLKEELKMRFNEIMPLRDDEMRRIYVEDAPLTPEETLRKASTVDDLGFIGIDFADLLIQGETTESAMSHIYRTYMLGAKSLRVPIVVLSQLNRIYNGGIPRPKHIRWTGLAEALAWGLIMLYNPNSNWFSNEEESDVLPPVRGCSYIIVWKQRGGFRKHPDEAPGAIRVQFRGDLGWRFDQPGKWLSLANLS